MSREINTICIAIDAARMACPDSKLWGSEVSYEDVTYDAAIVAACRAADKRIAELEAALERLWPWALAYGETRFVQTAAKVSACTDDIDAVRPVLFRK